MCQVLYLQLLLSVSACLLYTPGVRSWGSGGEEVARQAWYQGSVSRQVRTCPEKAGRWLEGGTMHELRLQTSLK